MRKFITFILSLMLICSLSLTCLASNTSLSIAETSGQIGEMVYVTLTLDGTVAGNSMGVRCSYDTNVLKPLPDSNSWHSGSLLQDFNEQNDGVWLSSSVMELTGDVCVLAFQILPDAVFSETTVSCQLTIKNGREEVGLYTAEGVILNLCNHDFGDWTHVNQASHSSQCRLCSVAKTESHTWDNGVLSPSPNNTNTSIKTYTCTVCNGTKKIEITTGNSTTPPATSTTPTSPTLPTNPVPTPSSPMEPTTSSPTEPTTSNSTEPTTSNSTAPTTSNSTEPTIPNATQNAPTHEDSFETPDSENDVPISLPVEGNENEHDLDETSSDPSAVVPVIPDNEPDSSEENHDHHHEDSSDRTIPAGSIIVIGIILVVAIAATCLWFIKKKH